MSSTVVFISHSRCDQDIIDAHILPVVEQVADEVVYLREHDPGRITTVLNRHLGRSTHFVLVTSRHAVASDHVRGEVGYWIERHPIDSVIAVRTDEQLPSDINTLLSDLTRAELVDGEVRDLRLLLQRTPAAVATAAPAALPDELAPVRDAYLDWVLDQHRTIDASIAGRLVPARLMDAPMSRRLMVDTSGALARESERVLVAHDGGIDADRMSEAPLPLYLGERQHLDQVDTSARASVSARELLDQTWYAVVLGDPGSGKSTLVRRAVLEAAEASRHPDDAGTGRLPVLVRAASLTAAASSPASEDGHEHRLLEAAVSVGWNQQPPTASDGSAIPLDDLSRVVRSEWQAGRVLLIVDGFDEIATTHEREQVRDRLMELVQPRRRRLGTPADTSGNQILVTSRATGYKAVPLPDVFVQSWLGAMDRGAARDLARYWIESYAAAADLAPSEAAQLHDRAEVVTASGSHGPNALAGNPFLLIAMLSTLVATDGDAARRWSRSDLYDRAVADALRVPTDAALGREQLIELHAAVAFRLHEMAPAGVVAADVLDDVVTGALGAADVALSPADAQAAVRTGGLLVERGHDQYGFIHLSVEEHLAGRWLLRDGSAEPVRLVLDDPRWVEPLRLGLGHLGRADPDLQDALLTDLLGTDDAAADAASRLLLSSLGDLDHLTEPTVRRLADWILDRTDRPRLHADSDVVAMARALLHSPIDVDGTTVGAVARRAVVDGLRGPRARAVARLVDLLELHDRDVVVALMDVQESDGPWTGWELTKVYETAICAPLLEAELRADRGDEVDAVLQRLETLTSDGGESDGDGEPTSGPEALRAATQRIRDHQMGGDEIRRRLSSVRMRVDTAAGRHHRAAVRRPVLSSRHLPIRGALLDDPALLERLRADPALTRAVMALHGGYPKPITAGWLAERDRLLSALASPSTRPAQRLAAAARLDAVVRPRIERAASQVGLEPKWMTTPSPLGDLLLAHLQSGGPAEDLATVLEQIVGDVTGSAAERGDAAVAWYCLATRPEEGTAVLSTWCSIDEAVGRRVAWRLGRTRLLTDVAVSSMPAGTIAEHLPGSDDPNAATDLLRCWVRTADRPSGSWFVRGREEEAVIKLLLDDANDPVYSLSVSLDANGAALVRNGGADLLAAVARAHTLPLADAAPRSGWMLNPLWSRHGTAAHHALRALRALTHPDVAFVRCFLITRLADHLRDAGLLDAASALLVESGRDDPFSAATALRALGWELPETTTDLASDDEFLRTFFAITREGLARAAGDGSFDRATLLGLCVAGVARPATDLVVQAFAQSPRDDAWLSDLEYAIEHRVLRRDDVDLDDVRRCIEQTEPSSDRALARIRWSTVLFDEGAAQDWLAAAIDELSFDPSTSEPSGQSVDILATVRPLLDGDDRLVGEWERAVATWPDSRLRARAHGAAWDPILGEHRIGSTASDEIPEGGAPDDSTAYDSAPDDSAPDDSGGTDSAPTGSGGTSVGPPWSEPLSMRPGGPFEQVRALIDSAATDGGRRDELGEQLLMVVDEADAGGHAIAVLTDTATARLDESSAEALIGALSTWNRCRLLDDARSVGWTLDPLILLPDHPALVAVRNLAAAPPRAWPAASSLLVALAVPLATAGAGSDLFDVALHAGDEDLARRLARAIGAAVPEVSDVLAAIVEERHDDADGSPFEQLLPHLPATARTGVSGRSGSQVLFRCWPDGDPACSVHRLVTHAERVERPLELWNDNRSWMLERFGQLPADVAAAAAARLIRVAPPLATELSDQVAVSQDDSGPVATEIRAVVESHTENDPDASADADADAEQAPAPEPDEDLLAEIARAHAGRVLLGLAALARDGLRALEAPDPLTERSATGATIPAATIARVASSPSEQGPAAERLLAHGSATPTAAADLERVRQSSHGRLADLAALQLALLHHHEPATVRAVARLIADDDDVVRRRASGAFRGVAGPMYLSGVGAAVVAEMARACVHAAAASARVTLGWALADVVFDSVAELTAALDQLADDAVARARLLQAVERIPDLATADAIASWSATLTPDDQHALLQGLTTGAEGQRSSVSTLAPLLDRARALIERADDDVAAQALDLLGHIGTHDDVELACDLAFAPSDDPVTIAATRCLGRLLARLDLPADRRAALVADLWDAARSAPDRERRGAAVCALVLTGAAPDLAPRGVDNGAVLHGLLAATPRYVGDDYRQLIRRAADFIVRQPDVAPERHAQQARANVAQLVTSLRRSLERESQGPKSWAWQTPSAGDFACVLAALAVSHPALIRRLADTDPDLTDLASTLARDGKSWLDRESAVVLLGRLGRGDEATVAALLDAVADVGAVELAAIEALQWLEEIDAPALAVLVEATLDARTARAHAAVQALATLSAGRALTADQRGRARSAIRSLAASGDDREVHLDSAAGIISLGSISDMAADALERVGSDAAAGRSSFSATTDVALLDAFSDRGLLVRLVLADLPASDPIKHQLEALRTIHGDAASSPAIEAVAQIAGWAAPPSRASLIAVLEQLIDASADHTHRASPEG